MANVIFDESLRSVVRDDAERGAVEEVPTEGVDSRDRGANAPRSAPGAERVAVAVQNRLLKGLNDFEADCVQIVPILTLCGFFFCIDCRFFLMVESILFLSCCCSVWGIARQSRIAEN